MISFSSDGGLLVSTLTIVRNSAERASLWKVMMTLVVGSVEMSYFDEHLQERVNLVLQTARICARRELKFALKSLKSSEDEALIFRWIILDAFSCTRLSSGNPEKIEVCTGVSVNLKQLATRQHDNTTARSIDYLVYRFAQRKTTSNPRGSTSDGNGPPPTHTHTLPLMYTKVERVNRGVQPTRVIERAGKLIGRRLLPRCKTINKLSRARVPGSIAFRSQRA